MLKLFGLLLPLSLDTFAVSAAIGATGVSRRERLRLSLVLALFEGAMPIAGLLIGRQAAQLIGSWAELVAAAALVGVGLLMLRSDNDGEPRVDQWTRGHGVAMLGVGISVSLDELAIGFVIGLLGIPFGLAIGLIAAQAFLASQAGLRLGSAAGAAARQWAECLAGVALIVLGLGLLAARLAGITL